METYNHDVKDCGGVHSTNYTNGCRCDACKEWSFVKSKSHKLRKLRGEVDHLVDAGPTREMILRLRELGYTNKELNRFGVHRIHEILYGSGKVRVSTERKVMEISGRRLTDSERVSNKAATMLITGWRERGLTDAEIGEMCGLGRQTIPDIRKGTRSMMEAKSLGKILKAKPAIDELAIRREAGL